MMNKRVVFITGSTAIGKTSLSIDIAKKLETEIISCDSRQIYKELLIGSAPPNKDQLSQVKHHFIQTISVNNNYNAGQFEIDALKTINNIHKYKDTIIIVGGSGLYIDAICKGFDDIPLILPSLREQLNQTLKQKGLLWLQEEVKRIDMEFYKKCDIKNPQRLLRALEVYQQTGKTLSSFRVKTKKNREFEIIKIGLKTNREVLYNKINKRVDLMIQNGLIEEVSGLIEYKHLNALKTIGYKEIFEFLENKVTLNEAINNIKRNTRRFAKRQLTWFKKDSEISWFDHDQIKEIIQFIEV